MFTDSHNVDDRLVETDAVFAIREAGIQPFHVFHDIRLTTHYQSGIQTCRSSSHVIWTLVWVSLTGETAECRNLTAWKRPFLRLTFQTTVSQQGVARIL